MRVTIDAAPPRRTEDRDAGIRVPTPATLADAVRAAGAGDAKVIAGGQSLLAVMKLGLAGRTNARRPGRRARPQAYRARRGRPHDRRDGHARRGGVVRGRAAGDPGARCAGRPDRRPPGAPPRTLGGSLASNDPAACYPAALLALDATVHTDRRRIAAADFFVGLYRPALAEDELITAVSFPRPQRAAYGQVQAAGVASPSRRRVRREERACGVRVAVTGAGPGVMRVPVCSRSGWAGLERRGMRRRRSTPKA